MDEVIARNLSVITAHGPHASQRETSLAWSRRILALVQENCSDDVSVGRLEFAEGGECRGILTHPKCIAVPFNHVSVAGSDISFFFDSALTESEIPLFLERNAQAFGEGTTRLLRNLSIAVVGCSGTGSQVIELLTRNGVGRLVLVDPDVLEEKNLNRISNARRDDVGSYKVKVLSNAIQRIGLGTRVKAIPCSLFEPHAVEAVAECDLAFGCMDSVDGRHLLNRLSTFYIMPYIDVGVRLIADGKGGISQICGSVHYLMPGGSSLLSRRAYTIDQLHAANMYRRDPEAYAELREEKYISGVTEDAPAVISVNMLYASLAVNELLVRLHPSRIISNAESARTCFSLTSQTFVTEPEGEPCEALRRHVGRGDIDPLLDMPELSRNVSV
jgi:hypothetical protein